MCIFHTKNKPNFVERQHFERYGIVEHISRIIWSALILISLFIKINPEGDFRLILVAAVAHLLFSTLLLSWAKMTQELFSSYPLPIVLIDILYITLIIPYTGLVNSDAYLLYIFSIASLGLRHGLEGSITISAVISILYGLVSYISLSSIPPPIILRILFFLCFSVYAGLFYGKAQNKIYNMATQDGLTSLYNQQYFFDNLDFLLGQASKKGEPVSLALLDLDNFKEYNDQLGHLKGDKLLQDVSLIIKKNIRSSDIAARYGGDEFVITFPNTPGRSAINVAERIRYSVEKELKTPSSKLVSASIGVSVFPEDGHTSSELFNAADNSLYQAKEQGKNKVIPIA